MDMDITIPRAVGRKGSKGSVARYNARGKLEKEPPNAPMKVLVVDDQQDLADMSAALLCMHGIDAIAAYSGADALQILAQDSVVSAVFSDIMMPKMTGLDLAKIIAEQYPRVCVVLASGYTTLKLHSTDSSYSFIPKPYSIEAVVELLRNSRLKH